MNDHDRQDNEQPRQVADEPPPVLGSWRRVYVFVVCWLATVITLFYVFSRSYSP